MGYIYAVSASNGYMKIGQAKLPYERVSCLQNGSPLPLTLEYLCQCPNSLAIEKAVHAQVMEKHRHREWFELSATDAVSVIRQTLAADHTLRPAARKQKGQGVHARLFAVIHEEAVLRRRGLSVLDLLIRSECVQTQ